MKQRIWRHINTTSHSGWFMWDVTEITMNRFQIYNKNSYLPTRDGGLIHIGISHSFSDLDRQRALEAKDMYYASEYVEIIVV
jgi:hypothetical protein